MMAMWPTQGSIRVVDSSLPSAPFLYSPDRKRLRLRLPENVQEKGVAVGSTVKRMKKMKSGALAVLSILP